MRSQTLRYTILAVAWCATSTLVACKGRESERTSGAVQPAAGGDTAGREARADSTQAAGALTDANIVALLDEANNADSSAGALARTKATSPDVKAFAKLMMSEHHSLRVAGLQLAKKLNLTPQAPANDPLKPAAENEMAALGSAPKGAQFDRTYIDQEVAVHKAVIDLAKQARGATQNEDLKHLIDQASPVVEKHLKMAEQIQEKLGKQTA